MIAEVLRPVVAALPVGLALAMPVAGEALEKRPAPPESAPLSGLTVAERQAFAVSVGQCWNAGALTGEARNRAVTLGFSLMPDGTPIQASIRRIAPEDGTAPGVREAFDAARRAILRCGAKGFDLPARKYTAWRRVEVTFAAAGPDAAGGGTR